MLSESIKQRLLSRVTMDRSRSPPRDGNIAPADGTIQLWHVPTVGDLETYLFLLDAVSQPQSYPLANPQPSCCPSQPQAMQQECHQHQNFSQCSFSQLVPQLFYQNPTSFRPPTFLSSCSTHYLATNPVLITKPSPFLPPFSNTKVYPYQPIWLSWTSPSSYQNC